MQGLQHTPLHINLNNESVWFKTKLVSQFLTLSFLLTQPFYLSYLHAAPTGGEVVGGTGTISQVDLTTTINQTTQNLAIDWQSFDVDTNERVQFIQPDTTSIALNRILGNNGSTIQGQIDANGQVILVNPNGIFFTSTATINVGGLVASSLDMTPSDFMNGNYVFNEVLGADGAVINSGIINASVGGNVALIGKQVKNDGLISANLGSVILAAGKQSILTFDSQGLIGVQVTKEVLQDEIGLEEAVINSGDINAVGGRVLLTASTSQDVFSQAVNTGVLDQATSVVVNDDGTFTLGAGADVLNSGSIDVSSDVNADNTARIVLLGENITSSGTIKADVQNGQAGEIEIHAADTTLLTENSVTSAKALASGQGGLIKILGDKVGLLDNSLVNASGENGGGQVLMGGDQEGHNSLIRNAQFIYLGEQTQVKADGLDKGNGGKVIAFAEDSARIHGQLFARGGLNSGDGGFIETSGLRGFELTSAPDASAYVGDNGTWLIDPFNITITDRTTKVDDDNGSFSYFDAIQSGAEIDVADIKTGLSNGDVIIRTTRTDGDPDVGTQAGNIIFDAHINYDGIDRSSTLTLDADNNIDTKGFDIRDYNTGNSDTADLLNIIFNADSDGSGVGNVLITDSRIYTNGGSFTATGIDFTLSGVFGDNIETEDKSGSYPRTLGNVNLFMSGVVTINAGADIITKGGSINIGKDATPVSSFINHGTLNTTGRYNENGGEINITTSGILENSLTGSIVANGGPGWLGSDDAVKGFDGGAINLTSSTGAITTNGSIKSEGGSGDYDNNKNTSFYGDGGAGGAITIESTSGNIIMGSGVVISTVGADGAGDTGGDNKDPAKGGAGGKIDISTGGTLNIAVLNTNGGAGIGGNSADASSTGGNAGEIVLSGSTITLNNSINANGGISDTSDNSGTRGDGNNITLTGNTVLNNATTTIELNAQGTVKGDIKIDGTLTATNELLDDLTLDGKDITFTDDVGVTDEKLGDVKIIATGIVKAESDAAEKKDFFTKTLNVTESASFTAGNIDTSAKDGFSTAAIGGATTGDSVNINADDGAITVGNILTNAGSTTDAESAGFDGQGISLAAIDVSVGTMDTSGTNAAGDGGLDHNGGSAGNISITATGTASDDTPSITLNGNVTTTAGTAVVVPVTGTATDGTTGTTNLELVVDDSSTGVGNVDIHYATDFTSLVEITGSAGVDTLTGEDRTNDWVLTGVNQGNLNTNTLLTPTSGITFNDIEKITGGTTNDDTLTASSADNVWTFNAGTGAVTGLTEFNNINNLVGNSGNDDFTISGKIIGSIDGGTSTTDTNTLTLVTSNNIEWSINGENSGVDDNQIIIGDGFSNIHEINAGTGSDEFTYTTSSSSIRDLIDGGIGAGDTLDMSILSAVNVVLGSTVTAATNDLNINGIETVTGNNDGSDALNVSTLSVEAGLNNTWNITDANIGDVTNSNGKVDFINFTDLNGSNSDAGDGGNDTFVMSSTGSISGLIDAGSQDVNTIPAGRDVLDLSATGGITLDISTISSSTKYSNFEEYVGDNTGTNISTVIGDDVASIWTIYDTDTGYVSDGISTIYFTNFNYLTGGSEKDNFILTQDGSISGLINGGVTSTNDQITVMTPNNIVNLALGSTLTGSSTNIVNVETITGDGVNTTLIGENLSSTSTTTIWNITGSNDGNVNYSDGRSVRFTDVNNLTGNDGADEFIFDNGNSLVSSRSTDVYISGLIDGGGQSTTADSVDMSSLIDTFTVTLESDIVGIESITGNNLGTLAGALTLDSGLINWEVTDLNDGNVNYINDSLENISIDFTNFRNLSGQDNIDDVFKISSGSIEGSINGGAGSGIDSVDYSSSNITEVVVGNASNGILGIEQVIGGSGITLKGVQTADIINFWVIEDDSSNVLKDGINDGFVSYDLDDGNGIQTLSFVNFAMLEAGTAGDTFNINASGNFDGVITGGSGVDQVDLTLSGSQIGALTFIGNGDTDILNIYGDSDNGGGGTGYNGVYTSNIDALNSDQFIYTNAINTYTVNYSGTETITDNLIASSLTVNGTSENDSITLDTNSFQVTSNPGVSSGNIAELVNYSNKTSLFVDALGGVADTIAIEGSQTFTGGTLSLNAENIITSSASFPTITANELVFDSVSNTGTSLTKKLNTSVTHLSVINSGALYLEEDNGVNIAELNTTGLLDIVAVNGDITGVDRASPSINADLVSSGTINLETQSGNILLNGNNQLTGQLNFTTTSTNDIELRNTTNTRLNNVTTRDLTVVTTGTDSHISQFDTNSVITSTGLTRIGSSGNIDLSNAANDFNDFGVDFAQSVTIKDINNIGLTSVNASSVDISVIGSISDANANNPGDNIIATNLKLRAGTGIGDGNALETRVSNIDAITTDGQINIDNVGDVSLTNLVVTNSGNISFNNEGNVEIGNIDAGYGDRATGETGGTFNMIVVGGSVTGKPSSTYTVDPDITAYNADITVAGGTFGSRARPISVHINNQFDLFSLQSAVIYIGEPNIKNDTSTAKISITDAFSSLAGQQLIEVESIGDIDPAIFTDVRNYSHSDLALMMPSDQRYDVSDEEEEDKDAKEKRNKLINSEK